MADEIPLYPQTFPGDQAMVIVDTVRGRGGHSIGCAVQAGWWLIGYALGQYLPPDHVMAKTRDGNPMTAEQAADTLEHLCTSTSEGVALAVDWVALADAVWALLKAWLQK
jgi:hypothetical protein